MFGSSSRAQARVSEVPGTLPVLVLPPGTVLLPGSVLTIQLLRKDNVSLLQHVIAEAERSRLPAVLAAAPLRISDNKGGRGAAGAGDDDATAAAAVDDNSKERSVIKVQSSGSVQIVKLVNDTTGGASSDDAGSSSESSRKPSVEDIFEWACAARVHRVERVSNTTIVDGVSTSEQGYIVSLDGICRLRIDRFTQVGTPIFEAQVTAFPKKNPPEDLVHESVDQLLEVANKVLDILAGPSTSSGNGGSRSPVMPTSGSTSPSTVVIKRLRALLRNYTSSTAEDVADILVASLLPAARKASHAAKMNHLTLADPRERVPHAVQQLQTLLAELESREAVGQRYTNNVQRRTREMVLRGLMEAIRQELIALRRQEDDDRHGDGSKGPIVRIVRQGGPPSSNSDRAVGRGGSNGGPPEAEEQEEEEEEEDELVMLERRISESTMPDDARLVANRELKRLKNIPPQSIEHGGIRNYLDWLIDLPWGTSSYDLDAGDSSKIIDQNFLERARKQLDDDHFGIDKVKERLLQYLAVLRLRNEAWEAEKQAQEAEEAQSQTDKVATEGSEPSSSALVQSSKAVVPYQKKANEPKADSKAKPGKSPRPATSMRKDKGPILLLVGPPGVGKTSIAKSLANALGRPYHRISLGGVRDEAEIRGFRRTYVGSQPGVFVQALRKVKVNNPVFLLDEIDKLTSGAGFHGDPSAAMLEVLDPEQNFSFNDHYINTPVDLSSVLFIATANNLSTIPPPLLDRMEVIQLSGYVDIEKLQIARRYLLPKQIKANQLKSSHISIDDDTILDVINRYCSGESGVRTLERQIGSIVRWKAVEFAKARDALPAESRPSLDAISVHGYDPTVRKEDLERILGADYHEADRIDEAEESRPGVACGLAYTGSGNGDIMRIEITTFPGKGGLRLTGSLGDVISESSQLALSWVRSNAYELGLTSDKKEDIMRDIDLHLHMPAGSIRKEGPSAGVAIVLAMVSLFSGHALDSTLAMTGEITLRGKVTPVGGIKEKVLAAHRAGIRRVILPSRNRKDIVADLPQRIRDDIEILYADDIWQALDYAFGERLWHPAPELPPRRRRDPLQVSSRL